MARSARLNRKLLSLETVMFGYLSGLTGSRTALWPVLESASGQPDGASEANPMDCVGGRWRRSAVGAAGPAPGGGVRGPAGGRAEGRLGPSRRPGRARGGQCAGAEPGSAGYDARTGDCAGHSAAAARVGLVGCSLRAPRRSRGTRQGHVLHTSLRI